MTTVFLSGSRKISRLNEAIRERVQNILDQGFRVVVGDANGADKALQGYLAEKDYRNVVVYCAGKVCRNNVGEWEVSKVSVDPKLKGRAFYTQKDKVMAEEADFGLVLWDCKSAGSINNVAELLKKGKKAAVYLSPEKRFVNVTSSEDVDDLIQSCAPTDFHAIKKNLVMSRDLDTVQGALNL